MKKPPAAVVLLTLLSLLLPTSSPACPITTLWDQIADADLIVVARVERIEADPASADPSIEEPSADPHNVTLRILETWKGSAESDVQVAFPWGAPSDFEVGDILVQFLERGETRARRSRESLTEMEGVMADLAREAEESGDESIEWTAEDQADSWRQVEKFTEWSAGRWFPIHFWPDLRNADDEVLEAVKDLVEQAVRLQAAGASEEEKTDWSVSAVERYATRRYGLWDLSPGNLTDDQRRRLAAAFVREPAVNETDFYLLGLFEGYTSFDVDRAAAAVIEAGFLIEPIPWWVTAMVDEALKRYGDSFADRIGRDDRDSHGRLIYTGKGQNTLPTIWEVARRELGIPIVLPAEAPKRLSSDEKD